MSGGNNNNLFLITLLLMFVLFLSMISVVMRLSNALFVLEIVIYIALLIFASILVNGVLKSRKRVWPGLLIFFSLNLVNQLLLLIKSSSLRELVLPLLVSLIGFMIAITRKNGAAVELKAYSSEQKAEKETEEDKKKQEIGRAHV